MNRGPCSEHLGEGDWVLFLFAPWMDEELKKEEKEKVQQRGLEEAKGEENPTHAERKRTGKKTKKTSRTQKSREYKQSQAVTRAIQ